MAEKRIFAIVTIVLLIAAMSGLVASPALGQQPQRVPVLIGFARQPGSAEETLIQGMGGTIKYTYHLVPAIAATIPEAAIAGLLRHPRVVRIEPDIAVYAVDVFATELDNTWGVKRIGAGDVHAYNKGTGVKVAVIDSGIDYNHPDLGGCFGEECHVAGGYDFVNSDDDPMDDNGHGTHVAGTVAALRDGEGVVGVAPEAALYGLKVLGADGSGSYSDVVAALEWAVDNGMQVTNNSYGSSGDPGATVKTAFDNAYAAGILHVCAAGNSGSPAGRGDNVIYPARYESCIAVAATDKSDKRASWSSTGPAVELAAPGVSIRSTVPDGGYADWSGTSMASPHVAGIAALVWVAYPSWTNADVRTHLQNTADDLGATGRDTHYGYGLVNAYEAAGEVTPVTDIAITAVSAPGSVVEGDTVSVDVTVENVGNQDVIADINVTLTEAIIGTQTISGLAAGASTILTFSWDTTNASPGDHTLTASHDFTDDDATNNSKSTTVTVTEPGATMHVGDLDGTADIKGRSGRWEVFVTVTIHDGDCNPVANATVTGEWSGATSGTVSGTTGSDGTVTFSAGSMSGGTEVTFTVEKVEHDSLTYDATANHDPDGDSDGTSITVYK